MDERNDQVSTNLDSWIAEINEKCSKMERILLKSVTQSSGYPRSTIHRLPADLRAQIPLRCYKARLVKFGPYHGTTVILPSHRIKEPVLLYFLKRSNKSLDDCVTALREVAPDLREMYDLAQDQWPQDNNAFIKLMILDGCFLIEILRELNNYAGGDDNSDHPLWDVDGISRSKLIEDYKHDMLLLENQLPMLLLVKLHAVETGTDIETASGEVKKCIRRIIFSILSIDITWIDRGNYLHVLDLYRHYLVHREAGQTKIGMCSQTKIGLCLSNIPSLTDLKDVGIEIRSATRRLTDISFERETLMLKLPQIYINDGTRTMFINIIAFEQPRENAKNEPCENAKNEVSSYIYLMSCLIKGANDVSILRSCGVIRSSLDNDQVAEMFNSLAEYIRGDKRNSGDEGPLMCSTYGEVGAELKRTFSSREWKKKLWRKYLGSSWAIFFHVSAFLGFAIAVVQTVYAVLGHYKSK